MAQKATKGAPFYFLVGAIVLMATLLFFVFRPFLYALILVSVMGVVVRPAYDRARRALRVSDGVAAGFAASAVLVLIVAPLAFLGVQVFEEAYGVYSSLRTGGGGALWDSFRSFAGDRLSLDFGAYAESLFDWIVAHLGDIFSGLARFGASVVVFVMALYYVLKDGQRAKRALVALSPLADDDDEEIASTLSRAVRSVILGRLVVAFMQGLLAMAGFFAFGVPNAVLWGSAASITALIPGVGTALVVLPAALHLFLAGSAVKAILLALWGVGVVGLVDNLVGPKLIGRGIPIHSFVILLSVLGGIALFGPPGFILGPLSVSLFFALLDAYRKDIARD